jgi:hypothetical protein
MGQFLTGAIAMGFGVAAMFFWIYWRATRDRLFLLFSLSLLVLAANRLALGLADLHGMRGDYFYWIRLLAFVLILVAIIDKNRSRPTRT